MITINVTQFKKITVEDCLNQSTFLTIEPIVDAIVTYVLTKLKDNHQYKNLSTDDTIMLQFLTQSLLRICKSQVYLEQKDSLNIQQDDLYGMIRKYYFIHTGNLI